MKFVLCVFLALATLTPGAVSAQGDVDRLSTYAVLLGRAVACGVSVDSQSRRVGAWIDRTWFGQERSAMVLAFAAGMENAAKMQRDGRTPDSCSKVRDVINTTPWP